MALQGLLYLGRKAFTMVTANDMAAAAKGSRPRWRVFSDCRCNLSCGDSPSSSTPASPQPRRRFPRGRAAPHSIRRFATTPQYSTATPETHGRLPPVEIRLVDPTNGQPHQLPIRTIVTAETADGTIDATLNSTLIGYAPIEAGDKAGWELGQATTTSVDMDLDGSLSAGDITTATRYDDRGRVIENRQPKSNGNDAGTRATVYYTAGASSVTPCGNKPGWAGMPCRVGPAVQPAGQTMPVTTYEYSWHLESQQETLTSGSVVSTATTTFDSGDRPAALATSVTGMSTSHPVPTIAFNYDLSMGADTGTSSAWGSTAISYDSWGRPTTYSNTPAGGSSDLTVTTYDLAGRVASVADGNGASTFGYNGIAADGNAERRGMATSVEVKLIGGTSYTSTGGYDPAGALVLEKLPGELIRRTNIDIAGHPTEVAVSGQGLDPVTNTLVADQPWFGWSTRSNVAGRAVHEWTPAGASLDSSTGTTSILSDRHYGYDRAGRLTIVDDITGDAPCVTRSYAFDANGNRTSQTTASPGTGSTCSTTGTTTSRTFDAADRPTSGANGIGAYVYDQLGRQTIIPAGDAPDSGAGNLELAYYDSDVVRSVKQAGRVTTYTLDGAGRPHSADESDTTHRVVLHYNDEGDRPAWSVDSRGGATTTTRYAKLLQGDFGLSMMSTSGSEASTAKLHIADPSGHLATTVNLPTDTSNPAAGIDNWTTFEEYGQPSAAQSNETGGAGYNWHGANQRAVDRSGLILMGARVYNRATGSFSSADKAYGGNTTAYNYPTDPISQSDTSGLGCEMSIYNPHFSSHAWRKFRLKRINVIFRLHCSYDPIGNLRMRSQIQKLVYGYWVSSVPSVPTVLNAGTGQGMRVSRSAPCRAGTYRGRAKYKAGLFSWWSGWQTGPPAWVTCRYGGGGSW